MATISTGFFLENIVHPSLAKKYSRNNGLSKIAQFLEDFLNELRYANQSNDPIMKLLAERVNSLLGGQQLFLYEGSSANIAGDKLEDEFQALMLSIASILDKSIAEQFFDQGLQLKDLQGNFNLGGLGKANAVININKNGTKRRITDYRKEIQSIVKKDQDNYNTLTRQALVEKYGKTDFAGSNFDIHVNIDYKASAKALRAFSILKAYRFSLKNSKDFEASKLGRTNPFRMYASVIGAVTNYSYERIYDQYYRMKNCYDFHSEHQNLISKHLGHIYSAYELVGLGLLDSNSNKEMVDFLIVNDSTLNGSIKVFSTQSILDDYINGENTGIFSSMSSPFKAHRTRISIKTLNTMDK